METDILERLRAAFHAEALELLVELDAGLLALEAEPANTASVHRVFRAIHTLKGSGATAGLRHLAAVAHKVEEAFDLARSGRLAITIQLVDCGLKASDVLRSILTAQNPDHECPGEQAVIQALAQLLPPDASKPQPKPVPATIRPQSPDRAAFQIAFRPHRQLFHASADPLTLLDELRGLGQAHIACHTADVPHFFDLEPESCHLWWEVKLVTDRGEAAIRNVFRSVAAECEISIRLLDDQSSAVLLSGITPESLELFAIECGEQLEIIETETPNLARVPASRETLDSLSRAVHKIKGNAALLLGELPASALAGSHPLPLLMRLAHLVETELDTQPEKLVRSAPSAAVAFLSEAKAAMHGLLEASLGRAPGFTLPGHLLKRIALPAKPEDLPENLSEGVPKDVPENVREDVPEDAGAIAFRNTATQCLEMFENCLRQLENAQPASATLKTYKRGLKTLASAAAYQKRSDLDESVAAQLRILEAAMGEGNRLTPEAHAQLRDFFHATRSRVEAKPSPRMPDAPPAPAPEIPKFAELSAPSSTIRIDQEKLERLMRVVGELLVAKGAFPTLVARLTADEDRLVLTRALKETGAGISRITEELHACIMSIRMLPARTVFQRFPRLVRDLAQSLGKEVRLSIEGETVELDKTILEQIGDPLVHLVRNSVDHGIEAPEDRRRKGKDPAGRITLRASNSAGNVLIEVRDDGRGLDAEALKRKAIGRHLITPEAASAMSPAEAWRLAFLPGLSTAEKVTDISGRGVGMDVVLNNIRALQGSVDIQSTPGEGTVFSIKLPTSLIITKGILLEAGGQEYILPVNSIRDMVKVPRAEIHDYRGLQITHVRGEVYSVISLAALFGLPETTLPESDSDELPIAVIESGKVRYGLIADRFVSEVEVLVKPLVGGLERCPEFHGAAIMGDGRVVLVLDPVECQTLR